MDIITITEKQKKPDKALVLELLGQGVRPGIVEKITGLAHKTIWVYQKQINAQKQDLEQFKANRADIFAQEQIENIKLKRLLRKDWQDGKISDLTEHEKRARFQVLGVDTGILYDKERAERGLDAGSVQINTILVNIHQALFNAPINKVNPITIPVTGQSTGQVNDDDVQAIDISE